MINILKKENCCGCTACSAICPHNAIAMVRDALGFVYPKVDMLKCVDCGLCDKVCAFHTNYNNIYGICQPTAYAVRHKDVKELFASQSGAAFVALSDYILEKGGVVYGAGYAEFFRVIHKRVTTKKERDELRGSKYVQSDMSGIFAQVNKDLIDGLIVLFSGTPCQTAALISFIDKKFRDSLILVDIICHGVSGPYVWRDYLNYLEVKEKKKLIKVNFRDKNLGGWRGGVESFTFANGETRTYSFRFYTSIVVRQSCNVCFFANLQRVSDLTIGDYWGVEKSVAAHMGNDDIGCSLLLVNTKRGEYLFSEIDNRIDWIKVPLAECMQPQLQYPLSINPKRLAFEKDYSIFGFERTMKKYGLLGWRKQLRDKIKKIKKINAGLFNNRK